MREGTTPSLEYLLRLMITADEHVVPQLRDPCLVAVNAYLGLYPALHPCLPRTACTFLAAEACIFVGRY